MGAKLKLQYLKYRLELRKNLQNLNAEMLKITKEELNKEWERRFNKCKEKKY